MYLQKKQELAELSLLQNYATEYRRKKIQPIRKKGR